MESLSTDNLLFYLIVSAVGMFVGNVISLVANRLPEMMEAESAEAIRQWLEENESNSNEVEDKATAFIPTNGIDGIENENQDYKLPNFGLQCANCAAIFSWYFRLPLVGYILSLGKCNHCRSAVPIQYPLVELLAMLLSLVVALKFGPSWQCVLGLVVTWFLMSLMLIDINHHLLPDMLTLPLMWIGLLASLFFIFTDVRASVIGTACGYLLLFGLNQISLITMGRESIGYGDLKLLAALGALLGWQQLPLIVSLAFLVGAAVGLLLVISNARNRNSYVAFGPFLAISGWVAMLWGNSIQVAIWAPV